MQKSLRDRADILESEAQKKWEKDEHNNQPGELLEELLIIFFHLIIT